LHNFAKIFWQKHIYIININMKTKKNIKFIDKIEFKNKFKSGVSAEILSDIYNISIRDVYKYAKFICCKRDRFLKREYTCLNYKDVIDRYNRGESLRDISSFYKTNRQAINDILEKHNVPKREKIEYKHPKKHKFDEDKKTKIINLYTTTTLSLNEIGIMYNMSGVILKKYLKKWKISSRSLGECIANRSNEKVDMDLSIRLYEKDELSILSISKFFGVGHNVIRRILQNNNIPIRPQYTKTDKQMERSLCNLISKKEYILPSGKIIYMRGYEPNFLDYIFKNNLFDESDVIVNPKSVKYFCSIKNKLRTYYPDFYIKSINLIVEIKSSWIKLLQSEINVKDKQKSIRKLGLKYSLVLDNNFKKFRRLIQVLKTNSV